MTRNAKWLWKWELAVLKSVACQLKLAGGSCFDSSLFAKPSPWSWREKTTTNDDPSCFSVLKKHYWSKMLLIIKIYPNSMYANVLIKKIWGLLYSKEHPGTCWELIVFIVWFSSDSLKGGEGIMTSADCCTHHRPLHCSV